MEVIRLSGYTEEEKVEIARRYLVPKQLEENGITPEQLVFTERGRSVHHQRLHPRGGLRNLEREIAAIDRKVARRTAEGRTGDAPGSTPRLDPEVPRRARSAPRRGAEEGPGRHRHRPGLDRHGRRHAVHRGHGHEGQGATHPHRAAGRRDEGVGPGGALLRPQPREGLRHPRTSSSRTTTSTSTSPRGPSPRTARRPGSPWPRP